MSAMRAEELPELPASLPQPSTPDDPAPRNGAASGSAPSDARTRAAARWTAPADPFALVPATAPADPPAVTPAAAPGQAPLLAPSQVPLLAPGQTASPREHAPHPREQAARRQAPANPPLRLTRRGRIVVAVAAALVLAALSLVISSAAQATNHPVPARAGQQGVAQITVRPGQTLWSVAENADPGADTRVVIQQITELNGLTGSVVYAGERLWVPAP